MQHVFFPHSQQTHYSIHFAALFSFCSSCGVAPHLMQNWTSAGMQHWELKGSALGQSFQTLSRVDVQFRQFQDLAHGAQGPFKHPDTLSHYLASSVGHTWHFVTLIKWGPWEIVWEAWDIEEEAVKIGFAHGISVLLAWSSQCVLQEVYQESKSIKLKICKVWWNMTNCKMACCHLVLIRESSRSVFSSAPLDMCFQATFGRCLRRFCCRVFRDTFHGRSNVKASTQSEGIHQSSHIVATTTIHFTGGEKDCFWMFLMLLL